MPVNKVEEIIVTSERFQLTHEDIVKWISNQIKFLKPLGVFVALLYIGFLIPRVQENGVQLADFIPTNAVFTSIVLYILNGAYDLLSKFTDTKQYIIPKN